MGSEQTLSIREAVEQLRADLGPEIASELCGLFLKNTPQLIQTMRGGLASNDARDVGRAAHELKSTAATLGANDLAAQCGLVEQRARTAAAADLADPVDRIEEGFNEVSGVLTQLMVQLGGG